MINRNDWCMPICINGCIGIMLHCLDFTVFAYHFTVIAPVTKIQWFCVLQSQYRNVHTYVDTQCSFAFKLLSILAEESPE